jgi:hypothetical protein
MRVRNFMFDGQNLFIKNRVVDSHISHFFQSFLTKNKVADSNSVYLLQISKQNES